jgi:phage major head subunit gpT-like protein
VIISNSTLAALRTNFSNIFQGAFSSAPTFADRMATTVASSTGVNTYAFMDRVPKMRQWVGERQVQNLKEFGAQIVNQPYELTIAVDRDDIEDDNLGVYSPLMAEMGRQAAKWPDQLLVAALQAGTSGLGFDAQAFFSTTHPLSGSNQSNNFTSSALTAPNYATARASMMAYRGADGEPLGVMPDLLVVPPQLEAIGRTILNAEMIADTNGGGTSNVWRNSAQLLVVPELANEATTWYLLDTSKGVRPFIFQQRKAPLLTMKDGELDENVFHQRQFLYGAEARGAVGYALWFLAARGIA